MEGRGGGVEGRGGGEEKSFSPSPPNRSVLCACAAFSLRAVLDGARTFLRGLSRVRWDRLGLMSCSAGSESAFATRCRLVGGAARGRTGSSGALYIVRLEPIFVRRARNFSELENAGLSGRSSAIGGGLDGRGGGSSSSSAIFEFRVNFA